MYSHLEFMQSTSFAQQCVQSYHFLIKDIERQIICTWKMFTWTTRKVPRSSVLPESFVLMTQRRFSYLEICTESSISQRSTFHFEGNMFNIAVVVLGVQFSTLFNARLPKKSSKQRLDLFERRRWLHFSSCPPTTRKPTPISHLLTSN